MGTTSVFSYYNSQAKTCECIQVTLNKMLLLQVITIFHQTLCSLGLSIKICDSRIQCPCLDCFPGNYLVWKLCSSYRDAFKEVWYPVSWPAMFGNMFTAMTQKCTEMHDLLAVTYHVCPRWALCQATTITMNASCIYINKTPTCMTRRDLPGVTTICYAMLCCAMLYYSSLNTKLVLAAGWETT